LFGCHGSDLYFCATLADTSVVEGAESYVGNVSRCEKMAIEKVEKIKTLHLML